MDKNENNLSSLLDIYIRENVGNYCFLNEQKVFICRDDGVLIYKTKSEAEDNFSVGALLGGVWQAAEALSVYLPKQDKFEVFRLSFDTSSAGIYIVPLYLKRKHYMGILYSGEMNPGFLKNQIREFAKKISEFVSNNLKSQDDKRINSDYLFKDISDEEIDRIFNFVRV